MGWLEKLDNNFNPTGLKRFFTADQEVKLLRMAKPYWRKAAPDKPKAHRDRDPIVEDENGNIAEFNPQALKSSEVKDLVRAIDNIELLKRGLEKELNQTVTRKTVLNAIDKRIEELTKK